MRDLYRKYGRVVRYEHGHLIHVEEAGEAMESGHVFSAAPLNEAIALPAMDSSAVEAVAARIERIVRPERLLVSEGVALHQCNGIEWSEAPRRIHLSIAASGERALIDLASFDTGAIERIAAAMSRIEPERPHPERVRVAGAVGAALLQPLLNVLRIEQTSASHDGRGLPVERCEGPPWPNWFRPSYRARPARVPLHLRAVPHGAVDPELPEAIALLGPPRQRDVRMLCVDGLAVYPITVPLVRPVAVGETGEWYPYGGGAFGATMVL
jgi:hypothetical protein